MGAGVTNLSRRDLFKVAGAAGLATICGTCQSRAHESQQELATPDYRIQIAPLILDLSPQHRVTTTAYNGQVPGPLLRLKENSPVTIEVTNRSDLPEVVHWHGLYLPSAIDGAMEEGTAAIPPGSTARYTFTPRPAGFRWYHTHTMAMGNFSRAQYGGQHGFLLVEPRENPARYDQEFFLALHDWNAHLLASDDGAMNPTYEVSTINGRTLGSGEPLRVRRGQNVVLHILNSSPTEAHWVAFAGHVMRVIALDGNPVPTSREVPMLRLAPAERVSVVVAMNNPGVWVLGEVRKHIQAAGMGIVVEYAQASGQPRWEQPTQLQWNYEQFGSAAEQGAATVIPLVFDSKFRGHGAMEAWTINGKSYPEAAVAPLREGERYVLKLINASADDHPLHLHRHTFQLRGGGKRLGVMKDVVLLDGHTMREVEFIANNPGPTLFHCHQQNHMDLGFMLLLNYA